VDHRICHFEIPVDDLKRAASFYSELFGWGVQPWSPDGSEPTISMINTTPTADPQPPAGSVVNGMLIKKMHPQHPFANYVNVESVDEYGARAVALGGEIALPKTPVPGMGYFLYLKDTEGNIIGLWENDQSAGTS
jgi:uncharacterized protein